MLDYIFFHEGPRRSFRDFLLQEGLEFEEREDPLGMILSVPVDLPEAQLARLDELYEQLMDEQERLLGEEDEGAATALTVELADGRTVYVPVAAELMDRLLEAVTPEELAALVEAVADAVEGAIEVPAGVSPSAP